MYGIPGGTCPEHLQDKEGGFGKCTYHGCAASPSAPSVMAFANDNALFIRQFSMVFQKMIEKGCVRRVLSQLGLGVFSHV